MIKSTSITLSTQAGGQNIMTFYYTDGTSDRFILLNGLNGNDGSDGVDGESPDISVVQTADGCEIYVDGEHSATLKNGKEGKSPTITASKSGKTTTIYADGVPIATVEDGDSGAEAVEQTFISDITFSMS